MQSGRGGGTANRSLSRSEWGGSDRLSRFQLPTPRRQSAVATVCFQSWYQMSFKGAGHSRARQFLAPSGSRPLLFRLFIG
jgi:hypothetical protein